MQMRRPTIAERLVLVILFTITLAVVASATLTPSGPTVSVDCGGQQTFTCSMTGAGTLWTITGLDGITASITSGLAVATANNNRVTTTDISGTVQASTITITGFTTADNNGGTVQCVNADNLMVQGMATVSVVPQASATAVVANVDQCSATLTWSEPSDSSATTSVSCTPSSPQCSSCTSSGCTIGGLTSSTSYTFSVTRSRSGCDDSTAVSNTVTTVAPAPVSCPASVVATALPVSDAVTVTWSLPPTSPPVTSTTVTYCPTSSPNCGDSQVCTSPCTVSNLEPDTEYSFTVTAITSSNCGVLSCNGTTITAETACICPVCSASATPAILSGVVPSVALILMNIISVVVAVLVTRHCYKNSSKGDSSSRREELYEQVEGKKVYEDVNMTDSPAYGPVI